MSPETIVFLTLFFFTLPQFDKSSKSREKLSMLTGFVYIDEIAEKATFIQCETFAR
jgi:hypothetical protein